MPSVWHNDTLDYLPSKVLSKEIKVSKTGDDHLICHLGFSVDIPIIFVETRQRTSQRPSGVVPRDEFTVYVFTSCRRRHR
jgi:hypothetical protein